jgi:hypothetical protein
VVEWARLESECTGNGTKSSNLFFSAKNGLKHLVLSHFYFQDILLRQNTDKIKSFLLHFRCNFVSFALIRPRSIFSDNASAELQQCVQEFVP